jgi:hypothetical protein
MMNITQVSASVYEDLAHFYGNAAFTKKSFSKNN